MVEGYMVYQTLVYITQYILNLLQVFMWITFGMPTPSTNLKGNTYGEMQNEESDM